MSETTATATATSAVPVSKKAQKKEDKKAKRDAKDEIPSSAIRFYLDLQSHENNLKCGLIASLLKLEVAGVRDAKEIEHNIVSLPAIKDQDIVLFGTTAIIRYFFHKAGQSLSAEAVDLLLSEELTFVKALAENRVQDLVSRLESFESQKVFEAHPALLHAFYPTLLKAVPSSMGVVQLMDTNVVAKYPTLTSSLHRILKSEDMATAQLLIAGKLINSTVAVSGGHTAAAKKSKTENNNDDANTSTEEEVVVPKGVIPDNINWDSEGLISSLRLLFNAAILAAYPESSSCNLEAANVTRCNNPTFGDFQCNNALGLAKALKTLAGFTGKLAPKDIAGRICRALPTNPLIDSASPAPNGFINIKLATTYMTKSITSFVTNDTGVLPPPNMPKRHVLVDFSSPNIAKEMHVGHLRSTIIGDAIARIFEYVGYAVERVNHVGDWGTQFGMLITYLMEAYPQLGDEKHVVQESEFMNISDLTAIYKESKRRFDADEVFKEKARLNVVNLQSGDVVCRKIWLLLCEISRKEFDKVYALLNVTLKEVGESFYNPFIPETIELLKTKGLVEEETGMLIVKLPHFSIPLILRKSDGGYGYDSTDMSALFYRLFTLQCDWLVYITDAGQAPHFHMCFDAGKAAGWLDAAAALPVHQTTAAQNTNTSNTSTSNNTASNTNTDNSTASRYSTNGQIRLDHIGFGVVCGDDGKRFKTRSSETVRLIDLLNAARDKMRTSLQERVNEGRSSFTDAEMDIAAERIGYGAVKYFDLKQHPSTNYVFNYDRMLDTKGDTAVYLMFAYARLVSILRKADMSSNDGFEAIRKLAITKKDVLQVEHPAERALAFELLQFADVIKYVITELLPNRLCDYLKEVSVKFTDFVTKCHVLNAEDAALQHSRLVLCEATRQVMWTCFHLLGITPVDRL